MRPDPHSVEFNPAGSGAAALPRRAGRALRGFTLMELVLVVILLAVFAAVTAPRFAGTQRRHAELDVAAVESFLAAVAQRDAFGGEPMAISYETRSASNSLFASNTDASEGILSFMVRRIPDPNAPQATWVADAMIPPARLTHLDVIDAAADGARLDPRSWRLAFPAGEPRPALSLLVAARPASRAQPPEAYWQIDLPTHALAPVVTRIAGSGAPRLAPAPTRAIDLDAAGRGMQSW